MLLQELGQRPFSHLWWQRVVCFWNSLCSLPDDNLYRQVALDDISDANTRHVKNWAWSFRRSLRAVGYEFAFTTLLPICLGTVLQLLDAPTAQLLDTLDICPRTCPSRMPLYAHTSGGLPNLRVCVFPNRSCNCLLVRGV